MSFVGFDLLSGGPPDYAKEAQDAESKRQAAIQKGTKLVNQTFAGFTPEFFNQRRQAYIDYALPQLSDQYQQTSKQIGFNLANKGIRSSSAAQKQWSDLFRAEETGKQNIADTATQQSQALQGQVAQQQQNLINQLYTTADPANAQQQAISSAASFQAPSTFAPLINQFSGLLNQYYISQLLNQRQQPITLGGGSGSYGSTFAPLGPATSQS